MADNRISHSRFHSLDTNLVREVMMSQVTICTIKCDCDKGVMFKSALKDSNKLPAVFAIVHGLVDEDGFLYNSIVFQGYCTYCGKVFTQGFMVEGFLQYKEVD